jgi:dynein heavy chain
VLPKPFTEPWTVQALLGDTTFMSQLQQYDKDNIPAAYITAVRPYLERPELAPDSVKKASKAAYGLCCWVRAMEAYDRCGNGCCRHGVHVWM